MCLSTTKTTEPVHFCISTGNPVYRQTDRQRDVQGESTISLSTFSEARLRKYIQNDDNLCRHWQIKNITPYLDASSLTHYMLWYSETISAVQQQETTHRGKTLSAWKNLATAGDLRLRRIRDLCRSSPWCHWRRRCLLRQLMLHKDQRQRQQVLEAEQGWVFWQLAVHELCNRQGGAFQKRMTS